MRGECLNKALKVINGERLDMYGSPENNFELIADLWDLYLGNRLDDVLSPHDVAVMMALFKIGRIATGVGSEDSYVDAAGYIALACDLSTPLSDEPEKTDAAL